MPNLTPDDVKLVRRESDAVDREVVYGRRRRITRKLKSYEVRGPDDTPLGVVAEELATFEQRTPGRVYVNYRWQSPRWYFYQNADRTGRCKYPRETRKAAIEDLLYRVNLGDAS